jgi:hypothetical protein
VSDWNTFLTSDLCVIAGEDFFIRCRIVLPIRGLAGQSFSYGVWSSVSKDNFRDYFSTFQTNDQRQLGPWFGWLSNRLPHYPDTLKLKCKVLPQDGDSRPVLELEITDHPLSAAQHEGLTLDELFAIYTRHGHTFS